MGVEEVEGIDGVRRGVMGLLRLWKCVEKLKARARMTRKQNTHPFERQNRRPTSTEKDKVKVKVKVKVVSAR